MTTAPGYPPPPGPHPHGRRGYPDPLLTQRHAMSLGYTREQWRAAEAGYRVTWRAHRAQHVPGAPTGPSEPWVDTYRRKAMTAIGEQVADLVSSLVEPAVEAAQESLNDAAAAVHELETWPDRQVHYEGEALTLAEARVNVADLTKSIEADRLEGRRHHDRPSPLWRRISSALLTVDLLALSVITAAVTNIDILRPLQNPAGWLTALGIPSVLVAGQFWAARKVGDRFNERRQVAAEQEDETAARHGLAVWGALAGLFTAPLMFLLLARMLDMATQADLGLVWHVVLVAIALVVGGGAPLVKATVVGLDGSTLSRRRDALTEQVEREEELRRDVDEQARADLAEVQEIVADYRNRLRPTVLREAGQPLRDVEETIGLVYLMLGTRTGAPSPEADGASGAAGAGRPELADHELLHGHDRTAAGLLEAAQHLESRRAAAGHAMER